MAAAVAHGGKAFTGESAAPTCAHGAVTDPIHDGCQLRVVARGWMRERHDRRYATPYSASGEQNDDPRREDDDPESVAEAHRARREPDRGRARQEPEESDRRDGGNPDSGRDAGALPGGPEEDGHDDAEAGAPPGEASEGDRP